MKLEKIYVLSKWSIECKCLFYLNHFFLSLSFHSLCLTDCCVWMRQTKFFACYHWGIIVFFGLNSWITKFLKRRFILIVWHPSQIDPSRVPFNSQQFFPYPDKKLDLCISFVVCFKKHFVIACIIIIIIVLVVF